MTIVRALALTSRVAVSIALIAGLTACAGGADSTTASSSAAGSSVPAGDGDSAGPVPGSTIAASSADARAVAVPAGVEITVLLAAAEEAADTSGRHAALAALQDYAATHGATVSVITGDAASSADAVLQRGVANGSDVIVTFGSELLAALDRASSSNLGQQFLVVGGQLPEPTENVTAVIWPGADARDTGMGGTNADPSALSALGDRAADAIPVGLASIFAERTGIVLALPE